MAERKDKDVSTVLDLSGFVTQDNAESGVWFDFELDGKPTGAEIKIRGSDSEKVSIYGKRSEKKMTKMIGQALGINGKKTNDDKDDFNENEAIEEIKDKIEGAVVRIAGFRKKGGGSVVINGVEIKQDEDSYRYLCQKIPATIDFVTKKSNERTNFLQSRSVA